MSRDTSGLSDPFLRVSLGEQTRDTRSNYFADTMSPPFAATFEFETTLPCDAVLRIACMDYDPLDRDELIGETSVDVEDRIFSARWNAEVCAPAARCWRRLAFCVGLGRFLLRSPNPSQSTALGCQRTFVPHAPMIGRNPLIL